MAGKRRIWSTEEKRSICLQTAATGSTSNGIAIPANGSASIRAYLSKLP